jgi:hypothetical protein
MRQRGESRKETAGEGASARESLVSPSVFRPAQVRPRRTRGDWRNFEPDFEVFAPLLQPFLKPVKPYLLIPGSFLIT